MTPGKKPCPRRDQVKYHSRAAARRQLRIACVAHDSQGQSTRLSPCQAEVTVNRWRALFTLTAPAGGDYTIGCPGPPDARYGIGGHSSFGDFAGPIAAAGTRVAVFIAGIVTLIVTAIRCNRRITVQPPLNQAAAVNLSPLIGWPSAATRTRMLFQLRHFQITALRPDAALPVNVHDRHNVSTPVDEERPAAVQAWSTTQKINVMHAGRLCGTQ